MIDWINWFIAAATITWAIFGFWAAGHALMYKRDPRSALGWALVCLFLPYAGPLIYVGFGINRIGRHAQHLGHGPAFEPQRQPADARHRVVEEIGHPAAEFISISNRVTHRPIVTGNDVQPFFSGDAAYAGMLDDIKRAKHSVMLATYIFRTDTSGRHFIKVMKDATERGVDVRVLIDGAGELYTLPWPTKELAAAGVRNAKFIPLRLFPPSFHLNLRNHRKILVIDGEIGYTGGMNIGDQHVADKTGNTPVADMHFRLTGPVVKQLEQVFIEDWWFATSDRITRSGDPVTGDQISDTSAGNGWARVITDGPDSDLGKLALIIEAAVSAAKSSVRIMTPYFLPTQEMIAALKSAALRGVAVEIVLPEKSNLRYVDWATRNLLWEILKWDVKVYYQPPPFAHTKLFIVDGTYAHIGSANMDPRSLRLNFEIAVEVIDTSLGTTLETHFTEVVAKSRSVLLAEVDGRPMPARFRDSIAWLFSPYL